MATAIKTSKVAGRRKLHFDSVADILADVERLTDSKDIRALGNWSPGQVFQHLAIIMNGCIDGIRARPPWLVRFLVRLLFKRRVLAKPMSPGFKLPREAEAELVSPPIGTEEAAANIRRAIGRLQTETTRHPHPVLGPLTVDEWNQLHCRHSELHLSFLVPGAEASL